MKVLVTGAAGFLGRGLVVPFEGRHELRVMDIADFDSPHEKFIGSVTDLADCEKAIAGCDAVVIAHMAGRANNAYDVPDSAFDVNVKGTANIFHAAVAAGVRKCCLISSIAAVDAWNKKGEYLRRDLPRHFGSCSNYYGLSKILQETIAEEFHRSEGTQSAMLRPAYITDADSKADKYGRVATECNWQFIDRRDIGLAAMLSLEVDDMGCEPFYVLGTPMAFDRAEMQPTYDRLGWKPQHPFADLKQVR